MREVERAEDRRLMDPGAIDGVVRRYAVPPRARPRLLGALDARRLITTALENSARIEDVRKTASHHDPRTTKLYDRRGYSQEKAASFLATR